jgi:Glycosyl transferase family 2
MLAATVVVPTHDHGPTLLRSVRTALEQSVEDLEVLIVGDGAPEVTRRIASELVEADSRVRFFDNPKGERHGELHRHAALAGARGEIVCYLSDDDLWLANHVEELRRLLADHDFAHTLPLSIDPDGNFHHWSAELGRSYYRDLLLGGMNRVPLSCGAHTLDLYRRLPGWRPAPIDVHTDLYMWQQLLSAPGCRPVSGTQPTVLHFPSTERGGWSTQQRLAELDAWEGASAERVAGGVLAALAVARADDEIESTARVRRLTGENARLQELIVERDRKLEQLAASVTWRLRARILGLPVAGRLVRGVARALAGRAAPAATGSQRPVRTTEAPPPATESPAARLPSDSPARRSDPSTR